MKRIKQLKMPIYQRLYASLKRKQKEKALAVARTKQQFSLIIGENENFKLIFATAFFNN